MQTEKHIQYGYMSQESDGCIVRMKKGQNIAGYPIGIMYIDDVYYPMLPGNVVNGYTFDFPVRLKSVENLNIENLFHMEKSVEDSVIQTAKKLEKEGVRAISGACGFFGNYQKVIAENVSILVGMSSLLQIPWIRSVVRPGQKIGILTADQSSITPHLLHQCGVYETDDLVIKDLRNEREFSCILEGRGEFDNAQVKNEVVNKALEILNEQENIGAILLECSDMPPYAYAVSQAVKLPVFDFITLITWLKNAVTQTPYYGFM